MHCPTQAYADVVVASADGRIDFAGAQELEDAMASAIDSESGTRGLVVDMAKVDYISSVGLRSLMVAAKAMRARKAVIAVASLQPVVAEIFEISRFHHVVDVRRTVREAIAAVSSQALAAFDRAHPEDAGVKAVRFWGTRGSIPVALTVDEVRRKLVTALRGASGRRFGNDVEIEAYVGALDFADGATFGGHTSCVEIVTGGSDYVICDLGTGVRPFGQAALARDGGPRTYHVFLSHVHWDHIMGLPFFTPAYIPGNRVIIYGGHPHLEAALRRQQEQPSFPVDFNTFRADISFVHLEPGRRHDIAGMSVLLKLQRHSGDSFGFRFESDGKAVVYSTDSEHDLGNKRETDAFIEYFRDADVVIFDAMYSLADAISVKADWGHSSNIAGVELCHSAGVKHLCMFHHEPAYDDASIARVLADTRRYEEICRTGAPMTVSAAFDGMEIEL